LSVRDIVALVLIGAVIVVVNAIVGSWVCAVFEKGRER
jgi:hypothetical protein